jgi:4'-phosphopantetheinyl transferase EntD
MNGRSAIAVDAACDDNLECRLREALARMAPAGMLMGCRVIRSSDDGCLQPEEQRALTTRDPQMRRASGAARHVARVLLADLGYPNVVIGRRPTGQPIWPFGTVGSVAHDSEVAVAAVAPIAAARSIGIDVEPALPLPEELSPLVISDADRICCKVSNLAGKLIFAAKEAVYKAVYPLDGIMLDYGDIVVDLGAGSAITKSGHNLKLIWCQSPRIVVLAVRER